MTQHFDVSVVASCYLFKVAPEKRFVLAKKRDMETLG